MAISFRCTILFVVFCILSSIDAKSSHAQSSRKPYSYWLQKVRVVKRGMTWPQVKKLLPPYQPKGFVTGIMTSSEGGAYAQIYQLDEHWKVSIFFRHSNKKTLGAPHPFYSPLRRHQRPQPKSRVPRP